MEPQKYITYLLLFVLICIVLVIFNGLNNSKTENGNIEHFFTTTTAAASTSSANSTPTIPITTSPLVPILKSNNDSLNQLRFSWIDNQQRLDNITKRINDAKVNMVSLTSTPAAYSAEGALTFY